MVKRFRSWLVAVVALGLVAAACGGDGGATPSPGEGTTPAEAEGGSIWVLLPDSATSPRWESDDRRFFDEALTEAGVEHTIVNAEGDAATQQSQAEQAIAEGASVIILISNDTGSGATIIDTAKDAGVAVVEYDRFNTGGSGGAAYVSFDNVEVGRKMAEVLEPLIDALPADTPKVVELNGGEEDNNSFLFKQGYDEAVQRHVSDGSWELVADQHVPGWGGAGEGQPIMEQILTDNNNDVNAVFAANDNLAQQAINAIEAAGLDATTIPISGQDASAAGVQNVLLGKQSMTVYKPIEAEARVAAAVALALRAGQDINSIQTEFEFSVIGIQAADGQPAETPTGDGVVPYIALVPIPVTADNLADTVIADGFRTIEEVCEGEVQQTDFCQQNA
jgi:D-xylose transport system substrate-binding protein